MNAISYSFSLAELFDGFVCADFEISLYTDNRITSLAWDSRAIKSGDLFFACDGESIHGKQFVKAAAASGASAIALETDDVSEAAILSEKYQLPVIPVAELTTKLGFIAARFYGEPSTKFPLIGITGTNGKTTISHLLAQCLNEPQHPCGVIGTMGAGLWGQLHDVQNTTPGAIELQRWFYDLHKQGANCVAMEVSSHGLEQGRTNACDFDIAVFTNLSQDHLDYHGDMTTYGQVKLKLFSAPSLSAVVLNLDDPFSQTILKSISKDVAIVGVTLDSEKKKHSGFAVVSGQIKKVSSQGMTISIKSALGNGEVDTQLLGDFNATNLLTVFACAMQLGFSFDEIVAKLQKMQAPGGRLEKFGGYHQPLVIVDYAHTPDALEKVLLTLKKYATGKLFVLMGCGGDRDKGKRPKMGAVAEAYADVVWLTNDNPRTESPQIIIDDILKGLTVSANVIIETDRATAIKEIITSARVNDVVLIAGKGHENYQIIGDQRTVFSDREIVTQVLKEAA